MKFVKIKFSYDKYFDKDATYPIRKITAGNQIEPQY